ncbi:MAG: hypothetical protein D6775_15685, partial [Caldilineae bacterium]
PEQRQQALEVADLLAVALHNARLLREAQAHTRELEKRVRERTAEYRRLINLMAGREVRMAELKEVIRKLRTQLIEAGLTPVANDPLLGEE